MLNAGNSTLTLPVPGSGHNPAFGTAISAWSTLATRGIARR